MIKTLISLLRLKNIIFLSLISLLINFQSCDILDSNRNHPIDPPIYPCPYQDVSISLDGQYLIFFRSKVTLVHRGGTGEYANDSTGIWKCKIDGTNLQLLFNSWNSHLPQFIPESQALLFNYGNQIVRAPYNDQLNKETDLIFLTDISNNFFPTINADGSIISYDSNIESPNGMYFIWTMDENGSNKKRIVYAPEVGEVRMPSFYPNMNFIVHIRHVLGTGGDPEIFKMDINGNNVKRITFNNKFDTRPRANFSGNRILFISDRKLFSIDTSGTGIRQLSDFDVQSACWTPDNEIIYVKYNAWEFGYDNGTIWIMEASGSNKKQLTYNYGLKLEGGG